jgi:hypothetical protein
VGQEIVILIPYGLIVIEKSGMRYSLVSFKPKTGKSSMK